MMKKILILGDSIRMGYDKYVKMAFEDVAQVYSPVNNCRCSSTLVRHLQEWVEETGCADELDLVYWNAGLWDTLLLGDGLNHITLDVYEANVNRICRQLQMFAPKAKIIFATSTPVQEELFTGMFKRLNKDVERYNLAAGRIVESYGGQVDDLYTMAKNAPVSYHSDQTHYYTKEGKKLFTEHVVATMEKTLDIKGKPLDFDTAFTATKNIEGL